MSARRPRANHPPRSVLDYCIAAGGLRKGMRVAMFIAQWTVAQSAEGREITVDEGADWWRESRTTWFRRQEEFRTLFAYPNPGAIADLVIADAEADQVGSVMASMGRLPAPTARLA